MAYQALLFCPDEKTARTLTQLLGELDFAVVPCTEPFAAVKRLTAAHFDAIVVDCANEQNAALLFKSALNSSHNQTSLAVAVVEGQADVAKAFRLGANLVLTKPINVDQAKGTLRVARGLLRKSEAARPQPSASAPAAVNPPSPQRPTLVPASFSSAPRAAKPLPPAPAVFKPGAPARPVVASLESSSFSEPEIEMEEESDAFALPTATGVEKPAPAVSTTAPSPQSGPQPPKMVLGPARAASIIGTGAGAAAALALARGQKPVVAETAFPADLTTPQEAETLSDIESADPLSGLETANTAASPGTAKPKPQSVGKNKKVLLPILAVALLLAAAGFAYTQFPGELNSLLRRISPAASPVVRPAPAPAAAPQNSSPAAPKPSAALTPDSQAAQPTSPNKTSVDAQKVSAKDEAPAPQSESAASARTSANPSGSNVAAKAKGSAAAKPVPKPIVMKHKLSTSDPGVPLPSPLVIAAASSNGPLPTLISTGASVRPVLQAINVSQGVSKGLILRKVQPTYPQSALQMRVEGTVDLMATVSPNGDVIGIRVLSGLPLLADSAMDAVERWKYKPYSVNGAPVEFTTEITVKFKLPR
jgi:TonB family protein